jgi:hypothetical protein
MSWSKITELVNDRPTLLGIPLNITGAAHGQTVTTQRIYNGRGAFVVEHGAGAGTPSGTLYPLGRLRESLPWARMVESDGSTVISLDMSTAPNNPQAHALLNVQLMPFVDMNLDYTPGATGVVSLWLQE